MAHRATFILRRFTREIENLYALSRFMVQREQILSRLSRSFPGLTLETTNICNANCTFCAFQYQQRPTGIMDMAVFVRAMEQFCEIGGGNLNLTPTVGDPLVDPLIVDRVRFARSRREIANIDMTSNLISLKRFSAEALIDSGITSLTVSTTGFDPAMYQRVYRSKMHQTVYDNIITFARANNARGRPVKFVISLRIDRPLSVVMRDKKFQAVAELVGPEHIDCNVYFDDWAGKVKASDLTGTMRIRNAGIARKMSFALRRPRVSPCTELYSGPVVYWDGKVGACGCRDVDARELIIGNLNDAHLAEIWFGRELERLRQDFMSNRVPQICRKCSHYNNVSYLFRPSNKPILDHYLSRTCAADVAPTGQ